jgi:hypothetical protein
MAKHARTRWTLVATGLVVALAAVVVAACQSGPKPGQVQDEAMLAGRSVESFNHADEDYFHDMDNGVALTTDEIKGRNMWLLWSGGNDRFWDGLTTTTFGAFDLLKIVSSAPELGFTRANRWVDLGLVNEPCFGPATGPDPKRFGLWLDQRRADCPADPFENETKYPGVAIGARGKAKMPDGTTLPIGSFYGYATGISGLRLFPNPKFDEAAAARWDAKRYYSDPAYYNDKDLVRPYRVGMSCGFCHIGPSPTHPPADPAAPQWANLSSSVGAQYMWVDRLFIVNSNKPEGQKNFMYQLAHTFRPGSMDTSLISTDGINNPRTMNAVYDFPSRMGMAARIGDEKLAGGGLDNKQFNDYAGAPDALKGFFARPDAVKTPHVLKDGADSVGLLGALNRVYLNIGLFSEEWLLQFNAVIGGKAITPIAIATAERNSSYWKATEAGTYDTALFFLKAAKPDRLADAPGGPEYLKAEPALLAHGKDVFADTCARCHSSKAPALPASRNLDSTTCVGANYMACFKRYWAYTQTDAYKAGMRAVVRAPDFLQANYLSTDARIPSTLLRTNACSPLATNALGGNIWDNFSSQSYKQLPSVGTITITNPLTGAPMPYAMPAGGRGYTRVPSLISVWSTAPYLLNNSVGTFSPDPSVAARMKNFDASIQQMLWPERRERDAVFGDKVLGTIDRTTQRSQIFIPAGYLPKSLESLQGLHRFIPSWVDSGGDVTIDKIPKGVPVGLLSNIILPSETDTNLDKGERLENIGALALELQVDLLKMPANATDDQLMETFRNLGPRLFKLSKCPDLVVNRGHYFGTSQFNQQAGLSADEQSFGREPELTDDDRRALIEFLKTF